jgi:hypothetical protein
MISNSYRFHQAKDSDTTGQRHTRVPPGEHRVERKAKSRKERILFDARRGLWPISFLRALASAPLFESDWRECFSTGSAGTPDYSASNPNVITLSFKRESLKSRVTPQGNAMPIKGSVAEMTATTMPTPAPADQMQYAPPQ